MFSDYLLHIGLERLIERVAHTQLNTIVQEVFEIPKTNFSSEEIKNLYVYDIPKLSPDGSCSILEEKNPQPYNLANTFGLHFDIDILKKNSHTLRLWRLQQITQKLFDSTNVDWMGIYRTMRNPRGDMILVKESYLGIFSRPEFPLTKEFAKKSNNSTVGLTGKAIVIQDVLAHNGSYYKCDGKVQSEFCVPILHGNSIIGIIDTESFPKNFYIDERLLQISKVAFDLGIRHLGLSG